MTELALEWKNLKVGFPRKALFSADHGKLEFGRICAVVGPNGSGKSVFLQTLCNLVKPLQGEVEVSQELLSSKRTFPERFGISINGPGFIPGLDGVENLLELARIRGEIGEREVRSTMLRFGLNPDARTRVRNYSMGMRQKLSLAQAFMEKPRVLVLDEPLNALDNASVATVTSELQSFAKAGGAVIFTSHLQASVDELADAVYRIEGGRLEMLSERGEGYA